jgi:hypothetical protein
LSRPTKSSSLSLSKMTLHFSHDQGMGYGSQGETKGYFQDNSKVSKVINGS